MVSDGVNTESVPCWTDLLAVRTRMCYSSNVSFTMFLHCELQLI